MKWSLLAFMAAIAAIWVVSLGMSPEPTKEDPWSWWFAERRSAAITENEVIPTPSVEIEGEGPVTPLFIPANYGMESEFAAAMPEFTLSLPATEFAEKPIFIGGGWSPLAEAAPTPSWLFQGDRPWSTQKTGSEEPLFAQANEPMRFEFAMLDPVERANHRSKELGSREQVSLLGAAICAVIGGALARAKHLGLIKSRKRLSHRETGAADIQMGRARPEPRVAPMKAATQTPPPGNQQAALAPAHRLRQADPKGVSGAIGAALLAIAVLMIAAAMVFWGS